MTNIRWLMPILALCAASMPMPAVAEPIGRITGIGGVFFKSKDPKALIAWYRDVLGIKFESWGGAMLRTDAPGHPPLVVLAIFDPSTPEMDPKQPFMINFGVDDLSAYLDRLKAKGVAVLKQESDSTGKFAWIADPDGTRIELWEPPAQAASK